MKLTDGKIGENYRKRQKLQINNNFKSGTCKYTRIV